MSWVIINSKTRCKATYYTTGKSVWATEAAAKAAVTRMIKKDMDQYIKTQGKSGKVDYAILPSKDYAAQVPMKTVTNLMSGKQIEIPADTPMCCDPSTETYWSM